MLYLRILFGVVERLPFAALDILEYWREFLCCCYSLFKNMVFFLEEKDDNLLQSTIKTGLNKIYVQFFYHHNCRMNRYLASVIFYRICITSNGDIYSSIWESIYCASFTNCIIMEVFRKCGKYRYELDTWLCNSCDAYLFSLYMPDISINFNINWTEYSLCVEEKTWQFTN